MIDIGANLADASFDGDRDAVIARARAAGLRRILVTGTSVAGSGAAAALARAHPDFLSATAGVHPHDARFCDEATVPALRALAAHPEIVAIGECGLDFFRDLSPRPVQIEALHAQLALAAEVGLPVFLHDREAADTMVPILREHRPNLVGGVVHCFTGDADALSAYLDLDLHVGITGWICDERRGAGLRDLVHAIPDDRLLLETDAPYLIPRTIRPRPKTRRNEPMWLPWVRDAVAAARRQPPEYVASITAGNAIALFRLG